MRVRWLAGRTRAWFVLVALVGGIVVGAAGAVAIDRSTGDDPSGRCVIIRGILDHPGQVDGKTLLWLADEYDKACR